MFTVKFSTTITLNGSNPITGSDSETGTTDQEISTAYSANTNNAPITVSFVASALQAFTFVATQNLTLTTNGTDAVQTVSITGSPTGGTFTLTFGGQTTTALNYNAAASDLQTALQALSSIGSGNLTTTGGPLPATPIVCTFVGSLANAPQSTMTHTDSLMGGSSPAVSIASTTTGVVVGQTFNLKANIPFSWAVSPGYYSNPFTGTISRLNASCTTAATLYGRILTP